MALKQCVAYVIPVLFAGLVVYAGQTGIRAQRERARLTNTAVDWIAPPPYAYEGPAVLFERNDGMVVFSRGLTVLPYTIGFDLHLHWDDETAEAALKGDLKLRHISAWMSIEFDPATSVLSVVATDDEGTERNLEYAVGPHNDTDEAHASFDGHVRLLFSYLHGGDLLSEDSADKNRSPGCPGGTCSCAASHCACSACCPAGFSAHCNCTYPFCVCSCSKFQTN